jgi:hypothetical protein
MQKRKPGKRKLDRVFNDFVEEMSNAQNRLRKRSHALLDAMHIQFEASSTLLGMMMGRNTLRLLKLDDKDDHETLVNAMARIFPTSSEEFASVKLVWFHGTCQIRGDFAISVENPEEYTHDSQLVDAIDWELARLSNVDIHMTITNADILWKRPVHLRTPEDNRVLQKLATKLKQWDLKLSESELRQAVSCVETELRRHPPLSLLQQPQRGTFTAATNHNFYFAYYVYLGEAGVDRYKHKFRVCLQEIQQQGQQE